MQSFALLTLASLASAAVVPVDANTPDQSQVYVQGITYGGTGCPQNTVSIAMASDQKTFTLIFDQFVASSGAGTTALDARKNCQVNVDLKYPPGFSYSIAQIDYRGYVNVPAGVTATQKANYYFAGQTAQIASQTKFVGPQSKDYTTSDKIEMANMVWSPCGAVARGNVNAQVRLEGDLTKAGQITVDSIDDNIHKNKMFSFAVLSLASLAAATVVPITGGTPDPSQVYIKGITYGGTGCPQNTVSVAMAEDQKTFTLIFDQFVASSGPGTTVKDTRKNCQVNVDLHYPQGFSYTINNIDYRGYVNVPAGVTGIQRANYYFSGQT
ncbi:hypothetical protein HDV02_005632, partial [Globomyces sp. JEL0801]